VSHKPAVLNAVHTDCVQWTRLPVERVFEPFFTTWPVGRAAGSGFSVVHGTVQSFGASITVESKLGVGTTFRIFPPSVTRLEMIDDLAAPVVCDSVT
jgi:hypothetical protein